MATVPAHRRGVERPVGEALDLKKLGLNPPQFETTSTSEFQFPAGLDVAGGTFIAHQKHVRVPGRLW